MRGLRRCVVGVAALACGAVLVGTAQTSGVSRQHAETFVQKVEQIQAHADASGAPAPRRTTVSEAEVNSWFAYHGPPHFPEGIDRPRVSILDSRRVRGTAIVDLDAVAKGRQSGGMFDVWNFVGGRLPVTVTGALHASGGRARFEMEEADVSGVPLPRRMLEELVQYYSRSEERPAGVRLTDTFELPAGIRQVELRPGSAIVVQ